MPTITTEYEGRKKVIKAPRTRVIGQAPTKAPARNMPQSTDKKIILERVEKPIAGPKPRIVRGKNRADEEAVSECRD